MSTRSIVLVLAAAALLTAAPAAGAQGATGQTQVPGTTEGVPSQGTPPRAQPPAGAPAAPGVPGTTSTTGTAGRTRPAGTTGTTATIGRPAAGARAGGEASLPADYRLSLGDKLRVEVYKDAQLSQSLQIRPDGKVTLPLIGDIVAAGLTSLELRDQVANALKEYVTNPVVTVIVVETVPPRVYVMGEVSTPGSIPLNGPMSVLQALAMAGGFRDFANTKDIRILRRSSRGVQTIAFNYKSAVKGEGNHVLLQPGDTVIVP